MKKQTLQEIKNKIYADTISRKNGVITVRKGFFYTMGKSEEDLIKRIKEQYPGAEILDSGEKWTSFRGGAPVGKQSHWYVRFRLSPIAPDKVPSQGAI